ncbi:LuxR C-terminal-related transcriptional regulator [Euzebya pacifica]|mgnify:CR=1 FL=1|uniref:LuxR C-terminal-related transcriptional regulator n=1 Tax=Euzebya pacifica TaxID=1608957 RepID=UPI0030FCCDAC
MAEVVGSDALTSAQRRVLSLVAEGLSNREIAEVQGVSPKTVANQLTVAYRALGVRSRTAAIRVLQGAERTRTVAGPDLIVDRDTEVIALGLQRSALLRGRGSVVACTGPPGCGRSLLASRAAADAEAEGVEVLRLHTLEGGPPFGLLTSLMAAVGGGRLPATTMPEGWVSISETVLRTIEERRTGQPTLLVVDDLHRTDDGSLRALGQVVAHLGDLPLALLATWPDDADERLLPLLRHTHTRHLPLGPLSPAGVTRLVEARLGRAPGRTLSRLLDSAEGNPFLVIELLDGLVMEGRLDIGRDAVRAEGDSVPGLLRERLGRQVQSLGEGSRHVLEIAALLGPTTSVGELALAVGMSEDDIMDRISRASGTALLELDGNQLVTFRHELVRRSVLEALDHTEVAALRQQVAARLVGRADPPLRMVEQAAMAGGGNEFDAVRWLRDAAVLESAAAPRTAIRRLVQALRLVRDDALQVALRVDLARAFLHAGELVRAQEQLEQAREDFEAWGRPVGSDLHPMDVESLLGEVRFLRGRLGEARRSFIAVGESDHPEAPLRLADAGLSELFVGRLDAAIDLADRALRHPRSGTCHRGAVGARMVHSWASAARLDLDAALEQARLGLERADRFPEGHWEIPWLGMAQAHLNRHEIPAALDACYRGGSVANDLGMGWQGPILVGLSSLTLEVAGRWEEARLEAEIAVDTSREITYHVGSVIPQVVLSRVALARGDVETAELWVSQAESQVAGGISESADLLVHQRALVLSAAGRHADGAATMRFLVQALRPGGVWLRILQLVLSARGVAERAGDAGLHEDLDLVIAEAASHTRPDRWDGAMVAFDGAWRAGDVRAMRRAVDVLGQTSPTALPIRAHAAMIRRGLDVDVAAIGREEVHHVVTALAGIGARADARRLVDAAGRSGLVAALPDEAVDGPASLSPTDRSIIDMLVAGRRTGDIAAALHLSRTRVERQVQLAHRKLGTTGRADLVAASARLSLSR